MAYHAIAANEKFKNCSVYVSSSSRIGEGEHKIFEHISTTLNTRQRESCLVFSNDSDIILYSLSAASYANMYIMQFSNNTLTRGTHIDLRDIVLAIKKSCPGSYLGKYKYSKQQNHTSSNNNNNLFFFKKNNNNNTI